MSDSKNSWDHASSAGSAKRHNQLYDDDKRKVEMRGAFWNLDGANYWFLSKSDYNVYHVHYNEHHIRFDLHCHHKKNDPTAHLLINCCTCNVPPKIYDRALFITNMKKKMR